LPEEVEMFLIGHLVPLPTPPRLSSVALIRDKPLGPPALFLAVLDGSIDRAELMRRISR
jgi:hypothetical protein